MVLFFNLLALVAAVVSYVAFLASLTLEARSHQQHWNSKDFY